MMANVERGLLRGQNLVTLMLPDNYIKVELLVIRIVKLQCAVLTEGDIGVCGVAVLRCCSVFCAVFR